MKWRFSCFILVVLVFLMSCSGNVNLDEKKEDLGKVTADNETKEDLVKETTGNETKQEIEVTTGAVDCNWTMSINDTIETTINDAKFKYSLIIDAEKKGGIDELGTYEGKLELKQDMDIPPEWKGYDSIELNADKIQFDVIAYNKDAYSWFGVKDGAIPIAPLVEYDSMSVSTLELSGKWKSDMVDAEDSDIHVTKDEDMNASVKMKLTIVGGKVQVDLILPNYSIPKHFEGMVAGSPVSAN